MTYVLVTGSTSGIGLEMARNFAKRGHNIILHGRKEEVLKQNCSAIKNEFKVDCTYLISDLAKLGAVEILTKQLDAFDINIFISNAGIGVDGNFTNTPLEDEIALAHLQVTNVIALTKYFINRFKEVKAEDKNKEKYILNVSSLYAFFPVPKQIIYASTKSFQLSFFSGLHFECVMHNPHIHISSLCPGLTYSNFRTRHGKKEKYSVIGLSCERVAQIAIKDLFRHRPIIVPGLYNKIIASIMTLLPMKVKLSIIYKINKGRGY